MCPRIAIAISQKYSGDIYKLLGYLDNLNTILCSDKIRF